MQELQTSLWSLEGSGSAQLQPALLRLMGTGSPADNLIGSPLTLGYSQLPQLINQMTPQTNNQLPPLTSQLSHQLSHQLSQQLSQQLLPQVSLLASLLYKKITYYIVLYNRTLLTKLILKLI